jgi:putative ABC transport system permease protein
MFKNYLVTAYRNLLRFKLDSVLNISGLVIGLTAALLIVLFIRHEVGYDQFWQDSERLYRVQTRWIIQGREDINIVNSPGPLKAAMQNYFPNEIQTAARLHNRKPVVYVGSQSYVDPVTFVDPEILDIFNFEIATGDARTALQDNASIVLNETLAKKYFGDADPIGKTLTIDNQYLRRDYKVQAVMRDLPRNTHLDLEALIKIDEDDYVGKNGEWMFSSWNDANNHTYIKLNEGQPIDSLVGRIDEFTDDTLEVSRGKASDTNKFILIAVPDIHLHSDAAGNMKPGGDAEIVRAFAVIAMLIVVVATINYVNLSTARAGQRAREVSMRKVMGARHSQLLAQHLGESVLLVGMALSLTLAVVEAALPFFNRFLDLGLELKLADPQLLVGLLLTLVVVGGLSGVYPALVLSAGNPSEELRASGPSTTGGTVKTRNTLVVFQTALTVGLIVATTVVYAQLTYFRWLDRGFEPGQMLVIKNMKVNGMTEKQEIFRNEVEALPGVTAAALSYEAPTRFYENNVRVWKPGEDDEINYSLGTTRVDTNYLRALGIPLVAGRFFQTDMAMDQIPDTDGHTDGTVLEGNVVINERAVKSLELVTPEQAIGQPIEFRSELDDGGLVKVRLTIIGVIGNSNLHSAKKVVRPEIYQLSSAYYHLLVRYTGPGPDVLENIRRVWNGIVPGEPFDYFYVDEALAEEFKSETNQANIFLSFALLTMVIGCLGLYGLAAFVTECRRREIGIRKILGARVNDIIRLLFGQFYRLVVIANLIAWPIAYLLMNDWLAQYPFRISGAWIFAFCALAGLLSSIVVAMTIGSQAWDVATSSPIDAIRHE